MARQSFFQRIARGRNTRSRPRRTTRPKGEGRGLIPTVLSLFRR